MADETTTPLDDTDVVETPKVAIPQPIAPPPRTTNDASRDLPLLLNWLQTAYLNILQAAQYINQQSQTPDIDPNNLPDPSTATTAQAQQTANEATAKAVEALATANEAKDLVDDLEDDVVAAQSTANTALGNANSATADAAAALAAANAASTLANTQKNRIDTIIRGTITVTGAATTATHTFGSAQPDTAYTISLSAKAFTGTPPIDAHVVKDKTYTTGDFSISVFGAPGLGNSVTYDWTLIRI